MLNVEHLSMVAEISNFGLVQCGYGLRKIPMKETGKVFWMGSQNPRSSVTVRVTF